MELNDTQETTAVRVVKRHQFVSAIIAAIVIALFLVYVALSLYQSSGTLQLDLSRPGYDSARKEAVSKNDEVFEGFSSEGGIDSAALKESDELYRKKAAEALIDIDAFSGDVLSDKALSIE